MSASNGKMTAPRKRAFSVQPSARTLLTCFLRTYLVGAAFNMRGMQNVGLIYCLEPGLAAIYTDPAERRKARKKYLSHYNTHMFWTPLLTGVFLSLEDKISRGLFPAQILDNVKNTTIYTLSAIGDSVFAGSLLVFWSLTTTILVVADCMGLALAWGVAWFVVLQLFKATTFVLGYKEGLKFLLYLKKWDLINWGQRLKLVNAALLTLLLRLVWPAVAGPKGAEQWAVSVGALLVGSWFVSRVYVPRELVLPFLLAVLVAIPFIEPSWADYLGEGRLFW